MDDSLIKLQQCCYNSVGYADELTKIGSTVNNLYLCTPRMLSNLCEERLGISHKSCSSVVRGKLETGSGIFRRLVEYVAEEDILWDVGS